MPFVCKKVGEILDSIKADEIKFVPTVEKIWDVHNFNELKEGETISSPIFYGDSKGGNKWNVEILLKPDDKSPDFDLDVGLVLIDSESALPVKTEYQFSFLNSENKILWTGKVQTNELAVDEQSYSTLCYKKILEKYLINSNTLRIHCQVSAPTTLNLKRKQEEEEELSVKNQLRSVLTNGYFADVILKTENTSFPASKLILAVHSPVFRAMFLSGILKSAKHVVKVQDFSDETVKGFLEFLYTGETRILEENPGCLLKISDKYQTTELKRKAESVLWKRLTTKSAVEILVLAHLHSPGILKPNVVAFVNRNSKEIHQTPEFDEMAKNFPDLVLDLYKNLSSTEKKDEP